MQIVLNVEVFALLLTSDKLLIHPYKRMDFIMPNCFPGVVGASLQEQYHLLV